MLVATDGQLPRLARRAGRSDRPNLDRDRTAIVVAVRERAALAPMNRERVDRPRGRGGARRRVALDDVAAAVDVGEDVVVLRAWRGQLRGEVHLHPERAAIVLRHAELVPSSLVT